MVAVFEETIQAFVLSSRPYTLINFFSNYLSFCMFVQILSFLCTALASQPGESVTTCTLGLVFKTEWYIKMWTRSITDTLWKTVNELRPGIQSFLSNRQLKESRRRWSLGDSLLPFRLNLLIGTDNSSPPLICEISFCFWSYFSNSRATVPWNHIFFH